MDGDVGLSVDGVGETSELDDLVQLLRDLLGRLGRAGRPGDVRNHIVVDVVAAGHLRPELPELNQLVGLDLLALVVVVVPALLDLTVLEQHREGLAAVACEELLGLEVVAGEDAQAGDDALVAVLVDGEVRGRGPPEPDDGAADQHGLRHPLVVDLRQKRPRRESPMRTPRKNLLQKGQQNEGQRGGMWRGLSSHGRVGLCVLLLEDELGERGADHRA